MTMMISKFHKLIQSKIVWGAFALLISVAFVGMSMPNSQRTAAKNDRAAAQRAGILFGEEISRMAFGQAYQSIRLNYTLQYGPFRITDDIQQILETAAWQRIAMLMKAQQLGMIVTPEQNIAIIQQQPVFQNQQTGQYDATAYNAALQQIQSLTGMTPKAVEVHFAEEVLIQKVTSIPAQGALVSEVEIMEAFHLYTDQLTVEYTAIPRHLAQTPNISKEEAQNYFSLNQEEFRMPEKVIVDYIQIPVADYLDPAEVTDEMVSTFYEQNKQRFLKQPTEDADPTAAPEFKPLEEVQVEITEGLQMQKARTKAADKADEFVAELSNETATFASVAQKLSLEIIDNMPAFPLMSSVKNVDPTAPFQRAAFALEKDTTHYYSDPVIGRDFVYVLSLTKKFPSFLPSFDLVSEAASESAKLAAAEQAYTKKAQQIHNEILTALNAGTSFADAIGEYKLKPTTTEPFDLVTELEDEFSQQIKGAAILYDKGQLIDLIVTSDEYLVAYVADKIAGNEEIALPGMRAELSRNLTNKKAAQLVEAWKNALLEEAEFEDLLIRASDKS